MTSKNLFFKLIWQDFKKRIWCPILIFLAYFLAMELRLLNYLDHMERYPSNYEYTMKHFLANEFFAPSQNYMVTYLTIVVGVVCALSGYAYLHSRKQLDTYHSMPVKREILFAARYVSGFLMFVLPMLIHTSICLVLGATNGACSGHGVINAIAYLGVQILYFFLLYAITIIAVCLTGNMIISVLGCCVLSGYSVILSFLREALYDRFFHTYLGSYTESILAFSPIGMIVRMQEYAEEYSGQNAGFSYRCLIPYALVIILAVVIFTLIAIVLYKKRATEAAGRPIAFAITEPFIKAMVVIPVSVFSGMLIQEFTNNNSFGWFVFGTAFGFMVIALVMEVIFRLDIKCAFYHWKQLVFNGACLSLLVVVFKYDVLGYNTYVPSDKELSGCAVSIGGMMNISLEERVGNRYQYTSALDYRFEHMNVVDNPSAMALARKAATDNLELLQIEYYEGIEETSEYKEIQEKEASYREIAFQYTKNNGKKIYRKYLIDIADKETLQLLGEVFADTDYKLGAFPILTNGWKKEYAAIVCESNDFTETVRLSAERQAKLFEVYQSELLDLTLEEVMNDIPLGNLTFRLKGFETNDYFGDEEGYKIYPSFVATVELLKEYGFDFTKEFTAEQVKEIRVSKYCDDEELFGTEAIAEQVVREPYNNEAQMEYTDTESKTEILKYAINRELTSGVSTYLDIEEALEDVVVYYDRDGIEESRYYCFDKENKPAFIDTDMEKQIEEMRQELMTEE